MRSPVTLVAVRGGHYRRLCPDNQQGRRDSQVIGITTVRVSPTHSHAASGAVASASRRSEPAHCQGMMNFTDLASVPSHPLAPFTDRLRLAVAAYLARFGGTSRTRTESDLRCYLVWCAERGLDPLAAQRPHLELYIRWMQEIRRFKPSTVPGGSRSRPGSTGLASSTACWSIRPLSTCAVLQCPPNRRPWDSRTCSSRPCSPPPGSRRTRAISRWSPCSACWACGSSKPPARTSPTSARSTATGSCACAARAPRSSWSRCRPQLSGPSTGQSASGAAGRSC